MTYEKYEKTDQRSCLCGQVDAHLVGSQVTLKGWVNSYRHLGGLLFIDLRDRSGFVQITLDPTKTELACAKDIREEYVIAVQGVVQSRPDEMKNAKIPTGDLEVMASSLKILSKSEPLPLQRDDPHATDQTRLKYRYIDLRRPQIQHNLIQRHHFYQVVRKYLCDHHFLEIETPILYKSTPEGARDYLVPSRIAKGHFYALVQSPQILKQLLMVGGLDRYFQIARCFRDEDLRADRQPEFTQVDIEMSFVDRGDVMSLTEEMIFTIWKALLNVDLPRPIPCLSYREAMDRFGIDRPDLRFGLEIQDVTSLIQTIHKDLPENRLFEGVLSKDDGVFKGIVLPSAFEKISRSSIDKLGKQVLEMGGKGVIWIKQDPQGHLNSSLSKILEAKHVQAIFEGLKAKPGDVVLLVGDQWQRACEILGRLRSDLAQKLNLIDNNKFAFVWVVDFPLLQYDEKAERFVATHHPFTSPTDESEALLMSGDASCYQTLLSKGYDLVCNGCEIAGGSIRIHRQNVQQRLFQALNFTDEDIQNQFGFFIQALKYGTPPHGGIALGVDRMVMLLCRTEAIRDVIAFPKTTKATCLMSDSPSPVDKDQLLDLGLFSSK